MSKPIVMIWQGKVSAERTEEYAQYHLEISDLHQVADLDWRTP